MKKLRDNADLDPYHELTRGEFYIELLGIWEKMLASAQDVLRRTGTGYEMVFDIKTAIRTLKSTYNASELFDLEHYEDELKG